MAAVVISGVQGGVGKTSLAAGLEAALRLHGCKVSRFSVGPGLPEQPPAASSSQQELPAGPAGLDGWLLSEDAVRACFHSMSSNADISLIEGCLGMFDSPSADGSEQGSTAQVAAWLHAPVVVIVDAQAFNTPRSILALVRGYAAEDGSCGVAGIILNKASKPGLAAETQAAFKHAHLDIVVLGALPLVPVAAGADASEQQAAAQHMQHHQQLAELVSDSIDLQLLRQLAATAAVPQPQAALPLAARTYRVSMGVARDEAFFRYFAQNLHMLALAGVQLVPFSPLYDTHLPPGLSGVLLGGGAVAQHAVQLSGNAPMLEAIRAFAAAGGLVIGEAGGLLYLSQSLQWQWHGQRHPMAGLFPFHTQAQPHKGPHGPSYVSITVKQQAQHPLLIPGSTLRGLATCCCQVLEERPVGSLAATLAAAAAVDGQSASSAANGRCSSADSGIAGGMGTCVGSSALSAGQTQAAAGMGGYSYSYSCTPLAVDSQGDAAGSSSVAAAAGVAAIDEGYTAGTALASAVQVHYGSCPEIVQHMVQRCLRVDVASVTAAAKHAAAAAAAAAPSDHGSLAVLLHEGTVSFDSSEAESAHPDAAGFRLPSPGSRALSAPNLQDMVWHQLQCSNAGAMPAASTASVAGTTPGAAPCSSGSPGVSDAWFCPASEAAAAAAAAAAANDATGAPVGALSPPRKSCSVPGEMWQLAGGAAEQRQQHQQQYLPYARYQYQQQQPLGFRSGSCPSGAHAMLHGGGVNAAAGPNSDNGVVGAGGRWAPPAFNVPKRWSMELQRLGSSITSQLLQGSGYKPEGSSLKAAAPPQAQAQQQRGHSRSGSRSMMHLPEEAPLSEAAIRILDSSLPSLLGRTHHTHIGVAVPLSSSSTGSAAGCAAANAPTLGSSNGVQTGGGLDSMSRSSSVHEQMSNLAASLALQEAAVKAGSLTSVPIAGPGSHTDRDSHTTACTEPAGRGLLTPEGVLQQHSQQQRRLSLQQPQQASALVNPAVRQQRFSLDQGGSAQQQGGPGQHSNCSTPSAFASGLAADAELAASFQLLQQQLAAPDDSEQCALQPELSFKVGLGAGSHAQPAGKSTSLAAVAAASAAAAAGVGLGLPPKKAPTSSSNSLSGLWAAGTPKAAAAAVAASSPGSRSSNPGSFGSILSLSPAATDILVALGLHSRIAGVTDACRLSVRGSSSGGSAGGGSSSTSDSCWQVLQLLEAMGTPWVTEAVESATGSSVAPDVVCRLVQGADGCPRYKLDEDGIRQLQPSLVVVACDENSAEEQEPHQQHYQQLKARAGVSAGGVAASQHSSSRAGSMLAGPCSSTVNAHVAVPGRVRLDPHVVQRVLQRAGVWGDGRAVVLYQRCHSLAEVLEFMQVLAQAAGVPERGAVLVDGLRAKLRAAAGRVSLASEALAASSSRSVLASRRSSRRGSVTGSGPGADTAAGLAVSAGRAAGPSVMVLGCTEPLSLVGFWVPEMLQLLGLKPMTLGPAPGEAPVELSWAQLRDAAPDVLVLALPGLPAAQAGVHLADLASLPGFWSLPAVRAGAVYAVDHVLLLRPGPSLVVGLEVLSHLVAPEAHPMPAGLPLGSVLKLSLHGGQRCRPRLVPHYMARYC